jgi:2-dehydro-3-deoxyphosphogluconate aldolase/(4S)-4-hydroxy-2-oxoglutarate aldolase
MANSLSARLEQKPVIPLIRADDADVAIAIAQALAAAGMPLVEVVQRTEQSLVCLAAIAKSTPSVIVGAGTVLSADQAVACIDAGAKFIVSPGLDEGVVEAARSRDIDVFPGIMTPTELQRAHNLGLEAVKFFPAATAGGVPALLALAGIFPRVRFLPTGGISAANLADYLALPAVLACAGSWMTPRDAISKGDFGRMTALAREALEIAAKARGLAA